MVVLSVHGKNDLSKKTNKMLWFSSKDNPAIMLARSNPAAPNFNKNNRTIHMYSFFIEESNIYLLIIMLQDLFRESLK